MQTNFTAKSVDRAWQFSHLNAFSVSWHCWWLKGVGPSIHFPSNDMANLWCIPLPQSNSLDKGTDWAHIQFYYNTSLSYIFSIFILNPCTFQNITVLWKCATRWIHNTDVIFHFLPISISHVFKWFYWIKWVNMVYSLKLWIPEIERKICFSELSSYRLSPAGGAVFRLVWAAVKF